jgi:hypothetical protein
MRLLILKDGIALSLPWGLNATPLWFFACRQEITGRSPRIVELLPITDREEANERLGHR